MNRIIAAWVILAVLLIFALVGHFLLLRTCDALQQSLTEIKKSASSGDLEQAHRQLTQLYEYYTRRERLLPIFIRRDLVNAVRCNLKGLEAYLHKDYLQDLLLELDRADSQILSLRWQYFAIA